MTREKDGVTCPIRAQLRVWEAVSTLGRFVDFGVEEQEHAAATVDILVSCP